MTAIAGDMRFHIRSNISLSLVTELFTDATDSSDLRYSHETVCETTLWNTYILQVFYLIAEQKYNDVWAEQVMALMIDTRHNEKVSLCSSKRILEWTQTYVDPCSSCLCSFLSNTTVKLIKNIFQDDFGVHTTHLLFFEVVLSIALS